MSVPSILIVDDKADLLELFSVSLRRLPYRIITAQSGEAAMEILRQEVPALVMLDVAMPYPSGLDILHEIRSDSRFDTMYIMLVTAVPSRVEPEDAALVNLILAKPITPRALEQAVVSILGE